MSKTFMPNAAEKIAVDYSKKQYWLSLPSAAEKEVDIFYIYPSSFRKIDKNEPNICEIDNPVMLKISETVFALQATAFEPLGNIYAPYYRQVDTLFCATLSVKERHEQFRGIPKADIFAAFDHYIKEHNKGRPFILAGHSLGASMANYLLSEYMKENPEVYARMIAAYSIGYSVTQEFLAKNPHLRFAEGPDDTGVIISYNTEAPEISGINGVVLPGAISINPITWTRDEELAKAQESLGSIVMTEEGEILTVKNYADARVDKKKGVIICSAVDVEKVAPGNIVFGKGIYHGHDYQFYYYNLRENAGRRIKKFLGK